MYGPGKQKGRLQKEEPCKRGGGGVRKGVGRKEEQGIMPDVDKGVHFSGSQVETNFFKMNILSC